MSKVTLSMKSVKGYVLSIFYALCACGNHDDNRNNRTGRQTSIEDGSANSININNGDNDKTKTQGNAWRPYTKFDKKKREKVIYWCYFAVFLLATGTCVASFTVPSLRKAKPRGIAMWQWSLLVTVLLGGPLLSKGIVEFIMLFLGRKFSVKENIIYYVVGLVESAWVVLWFSMILVAWLMVMEEPSYLGMPHQDEKVIKKFAATFPIINVTLITLILGSFIWLLKDLVLMIAKSSFHIKRFFFRIRETLMHQYVIGTLCMSQRQPSIIYEQASHSQNSSTTEEVVLTIGACRNPQEFKRKKFGRNKTLIVDVRCLDGVSEDEVSCWGMKNVIESLRSYPPLTYKDIDNVLQKIVNESDVIKATESIFESVVRDQAPNSQSSHIQKTDLVKYFPVEKVDDVMKSLLQGVADVKISKEDLEKWMMNAYLYREALIRALEGNRRVFQTLNRFINVLIIIFISALWLIMLKDKTRKVIFVIGSAIVGAAFIFGDPCKTMLENFLFIFWMHPFDIGDCCLIDGRQVIIEEMNVLTTTVSTFDKEEKHYPNMILAGQPISNYARCRCLGDFVEISLQIDTPAKEIDTLKEQIKWYIEGNRHHWHSDHNWVIELVDMKIKMRLNVQHTIPGINYHQFKERQTGKTKLVLKIKDILVDNKLVQVS